MRVITREEELALRKKSYEQLAPGKLFALSFKRFFVAVEKIGDSIEVIELDSENIERILRGEPCVHSTLHFDEMGCLNVRT
ncbi:MAG: hypothetical protein L0177_19200 [Chloroflexi bacterium]|nr:hypothetical protein [Chloroflexota bacterium]